MRNITFAVTGTPALLVLSGGGTSGTAQPSGVPLLFLQAKLQLTPGFLNQPSGRNRRDPQSPVSTFQFPFSTFTRRTAPKHSSPAPRAAATTSLRSAPLRTNR